MRRLVIEANWKQNLSVLKRVTCLLQESGITLELDTDATVRRYADEHVAESDLDISIGREIYNSGDGKYREVDNLIHINEYSDDGAQIGDPILVLETIVPIECKSRTDVHYFVFSSPTQTERRWSFPIATELAHHPRLQILRAPLVCLEKVSIGEIKAVKFDDQAPKKIFEESIIYNATGSLYDYIEHYLVDDKAGLDGITSKLLNDAEILKMLDEHLQYKGDIASVSCVLKSITPEKRGQISEHHFKENGQTPYLGILRLFVPVIVINGELMQAEWSPGNGITNYRSIEYAVTSAVKHGWPGVFDESVGRLQDACVLITNHRNLGRALELIDEIRLELRARLHSLEVLSNRPWFAEFELYAYAARQTRL